jgi:beta-lactamase regulating signal transducer with metallopeptidase domain
MINGGIIGAILAAVAWVALFITPRRYCGAGARHAAWWITLAAVLAAPAFLPRTAPTRQPVARSTSPRGNSAKAPVPQPRIALPGNAPRLSEGSWERWLILAWVVSSGLLLLRLARSYIAMCRIFASAEEAPGSISRTGVRVLTSPAIAAPAAAGVRRPAILIPAAAITAFNAVELEYVVLHEAAHLARRDHLALLVQRTIEALFWAHPVVRLIGRRIDLEREIACDDLVIATTRNPRSYATCLTRMAELCAGARPSLAAGFTERRQHLSRRVELIMKQTYASSSHSRAVLVTVIAAVCGLGAFLAQRPPMLALAAPQAAASREVPLLTFHFDTTAMTAEELSRAAATALRLVDTRLNVGQQASVIVWNGQLQTRADFTADREALRRTIRDVGAQPVTGPSDGQSRIDGLRKVIAALSRIEGRKALIGFAAPPLAAANELNDAARSANVAVYFIDVSGPVAR